MYLTAIRIQESGLKVDKNKYTALFQQARSLERNNLFDEAEIIYRTILTEDPGNKTAFNKIKVLLKNKKDWDLLEQLAETYQKNHKYSQLLQIINHQ